jgi:PAS domain S-box-containing protein
MAPENFEKMSRTALIRELKKAQDAHHRFVTDLDVVDPRRAMYELEIHRIELEMQNRELRESQQRLEDAQARYSDLYNFAPVGYCTLDPEGYIQEINLTASAMLETPRELLIGKSFRTVAARANPLQFQAHMKRCMEEKDRVTSDLTLVLKHGGPRTLRMISEPVINHSGVRTAYRMALIDVTEEKRFEDELQLLSNLAEVSNSPLQSSEPLEVAARVLVPAFADLLKIDLRNDDGQIERVLVRFAEPGKQNTLAEPLKNYAPRPGWKTAQAKVIESGEPMLLEDIPDVARDRMAHDETHAGILRAAGIRSMIVVPLTTWGQTFGALTFATAESGRRYSSRDLRLAETMSSRVAIAMDNVRLFAERTRAVAARDTILAVVSHDLGNSLNAIQLKAHLMLKSPDSQKHSDAAFILLRAGEMTRLIQDLLDISSIEAGRLRLEKRRQTVGPMVKEALAAWESQAVQNRLQLDCECPDRNELDLDYDPFRMRQVLDNLIGNAIKFTEPGGSIHVRVEPRVGEVCFSVTDSGPGIPTADLTHIFDRFTRASKSARRGTGLGLSIAKGIVEAHGGRVWAESQVGVGSTFYFTLPLIPSAPGTPKAPGSAAGRDMSRVEPGGPIQQNPLKKVVLVVDDDADSREMVAAVLEMEGYDVVSLQNGDEALEYLRHAPRHPFCILLDLVMPVADGWMFLRERNSNPELETIPVIVLSGQPDVEEQVIAAHASYLRKPLSPEHLTEVMHQAVR